MTGSGMDGRAGPVASGFMGLTDDDVLDALYEAAMDAQRLHALHDVPMVIWRDGKVAEISPAEFKDRIEAAWRERQTKKAE